MPYDRESNYTIELIDLSDDTLVAHAPTSITSQLKPDEGFIYELMQIGYQAPDPAGSAAGTHKLLGKWNGEFDSLFQITGGFGNPVQIKMLGFIGSTSEFPSSTDHQYKIMWDRIIVASNSRPFDFIYTNSTDVDQSGTRVLIMLCKKYREAIL